MIPRPNLVRLHTIHGAHWIDTRQLAAGRRVLTIYTARGNRAADVARTEADRERVRYGVHRDNLHASKELAHAAARRIYSQITNEATK